jgi:hypothetical protein
MSQSDRPPQTVQSPVAQVLRRCQQLPDCFVSAWLDMLVEIRDSLYFWMVGAVVSVILVIVNVYDLLCVLKHSETLVIF